MNIRFIVQYDGTRYKGWQKQVRTTETIQGKLEQAITKVVGETVQVLGAGRTDAGVHSMGQIANVRLTSNVIVSDWEKQVNDALPSDIVIISSQEVSNNFHSRFNAKAKTYVYRMRIGSQKDVFHRRFIWQYGQVLDIEKMKEAATLLIGTHDFKGFTSNKKSKMSTVRTISAIQIEKAKDILTFSVTGDGFLTNMVRIIVGTLVEVGEGKKQTDSIMQVLKSKDRFYAGFTAPPEGLTLKKVYY